MVDADDVTFKTSNEDGFSHEFVVLKTTLGASRLLVESAVVDEAAASLVIGEIEPAELPAGGASATFNLEAGTYVLPSSSPAHRGLGMRTASVVQQDKTRGEGWYSEVICWQDGLLARWVAVFAGRDRRCRIVDVVLAL